MNERKSNHSNHFWSSSLATSIYWWVAIDAPCLFFATVGLYELLRMKGFNLFSLPGLISTFILWMIMIPTEFYFAWLIRAGVGKTDILVLGVLLLLTYTVLTKNRVTYDDIAFMLISTIYIGFGFHYFLETRAMENGLIWIFLAYLLYGLLIQVRISLERHLEKESYGQILVLIKQ